MSCGRSCFETTSNYEKGSVNFGKKPISSESDGKADASHVFFIPLKLLRFQHSNHLFECLIAYNPLLKYVIYFKCAGIDIFHQKNQQCSDSVAKRTLSVWYIILV